MNAENFAEWRRRQGNLVVHTESSYWYEAGPKILQAFPYHWLIQPSEQELRRLMVGHNIFALRYSAPIESAEGKVSYHIVKRRPYCLEKIDKKGRSSIRQGLNNCQIKKISFQRLAHEGWELQKDTLERQGRLTSMSETGWIKLCLSAVDLEGFEAWGAFIGSELAAALITTQIDDTVFTLYSLSHSKFLDLFVNHALFFSASANSLESGSVKGIFLTVQSLDAPSNVDTFKIRMGFDVIPVRQRVVFHPMLAPLINQSTYGLLSRLLVRYPDHNYLPKAEGMMRFCLEGKRPIEMQEWPEFLEHSRDEYLKLSDPCIDVQNLK